jgi:hypothetical protein
MLYGVAAEFDSPEALVKATTSAREAGYRHMDAYTPFPVEAVHHALGARPTRLPYLVLVGGLLGAAGGFFMQWYANVVSYPLNIGGRPDNSWPMFVPVTFECTILIAALFAVLGMLALNGLPMPYHPLFHWPRFAQASRDRFFLCIEATDPLFEVARTRDFLAGLNARHVTEVPR